MLPLGLSATKWSQLLQVDKITHTIHTYQENYVITPMQFTINPPSSLTPSPAPQSHCRLAVDSHGRQQTGIRTRAARFIPDHSGF
jgi:hypothetical protein